MSIFGDIMSAIFGRSAKAETPAAGTQGPATPAGSPAAPPTAATPSGPSAPAASAAPAAPVDVGATLDNLAKQKKEKLDWKHSIVDLMKLLDLDSSLSARKELAKELNYTGDTGDFCNDEYLAAQAGYEQACGERRQGTGGSQGLADARPLPCGELKLSLAMRRATPLPLGRGRPLCGRVRGL